jgi:hypothetical protein
MTGKRRDIKRSRLKALAKLGGIGSAIAISLITLVVTNVMAPAAEQAREAFSNLLKHDPADTKIVRAVDGQDLPLSRNGQTPSRNITFYYQAQKDNTIYRNVDFECKLSPDEKSFSACASAQSTTYPLLSVDDHTFEVRVIDPNASRKPTLDKFGFSIIPSVSVTGRISLNNSSVKDIKVTMDNKSKPSAFTDSTGTFSFPFVHFNKNDEDSRHNFTFFVSSEKTQYLPCDSENRNIISDDDDKVELGVIYLENELCSKKDLSSTISSAPITDFFKPEKKLEYAKIDLQYNTSLVRKPSRADSMDGLWNIVVYLEGQDLPSISKVVYYLHPTFKPNNVITLTPQHDNPKYALHLSAYGGFKLYTKVYLTNEKVIDLSRFLITKY